MNRLTQVLKGVFRVALAYRNRRATWMIVLFDECQKLGGLYVKFVQQIAASEMASLQFKHVARHLNVFDNVDTEFIDVHRTLQREGVLGELVDVQVAPFASGSFAQVYGATLRSTNQPVIVKILRPSVERYLHTDIRILTALCHGLQPFMKHGLMNLPALFKQFARTAAEEMDYIREAYMADYFYTYFQSRDANVIIPQTYGQMSSSCVIIQERIYGIPLTDVLNVAHNGEDSFTYIYERIGSDLSQQLSLIGSELLTAVLQADFIMSDPHPGNIILMGDDKIAMIDFGLVSEAPAHRSAFLGMIGQYRALYEDRADMGNLAVAMLAFYDYELYEALTMVSKSNKLTHSLSKYISDNLATTEVLNDKLASQRLITQLFLQKLNKNNRFAIRMHERDIVLQKAMHSFLSTTRLACGEHHRKAKYWPIVQRALSRAEDEAYETGVSESANMPAGISDEHAQEVVIDWLSAIAERDRHAYQTLVAKSGAI